MESLKPGRELDALIAEKVMGYQKGIKIAHTGAQLWTTGGASFSFHPSTDIAAAWEVVERLQRHNITISRDITGRWFVKYATIDEVAETAPHAICLAALKAVGL